MSSETQTVPYTLPVVAIGASAGGLSAYTELLKHLDENNGMAYVIIQHLDPTHESLLTEILSKNTKIPVSEIEPNTTLRPDHISVVPRNTNLTIENNTFILSPRTTKTGEPFHPITSFFKSLAKNSAEYAIGIVLSGSGNDGSKGLIDIAAAGGTTIVQDPKSAKFPGMPNSAVGTAEFDFVLTAEKIGPKLKELAKLLRMPVNTKDRRRRVAAGSISENENEYIDILHLIRKSKGTNFIDYKSPSILRRINRRMTTLKLESAKSYLEYLMTNQGEIDRLNEELLIKVTEFFRDPEIFEKIRTLVLESLLSESTSTLPFRIWVPGCATGEEAYSLAILFTETAEELGSTRKFEIFASDISEAALSAARKSIYNDKDVQQLSERRLSHFFTRENDSYRISAEIRGSFVFAKQDVARDPPFSRVDLICCRNLLIYLKPETQHRVLDTFYFALNPNGNLVLGGAESIRSDSGLFKQIENETRIFAKSGQGPRSWSHENNISTPQSIIKENVQAITERPQGDFNSGNKTDAERAILEFVPPGVVVNEQLQILQYRGNTSRFLLQPAGAPTNDLIKQARPGLLAAIQKSIAAAKASTQCSRAEGLVPGDNGVLTPYMIDVIPFKDGSFKSSYVLLFSEGNKITVSSEETPEVFAKRLLEAELFESKKYLNTLIDKEQATNEALTATAEELMSSNEELQSTTEEMATAKEEIQASNEELLTVNEEIVSRNSALTDLNNDLTNIFTGIEIPIVLLTEKHKIKRMSRAAMASAELTGTDIGKPLGSLTGPFDMPAIVKVCEEVQQTLVRKHVEITDKSGKWFELQVAPYRTTDNKIDGTVLTLIEIDQLKKTYSLLNETTDYYDAIIQSVPTAIVTINEKGMITSANPAFCTLARTNLDVLKNAPFFLVGNGTWNTHDLKTMIAAVITDKAPVDSIILDEIFSGLGRLVLNISARYLNQKGSQEREILISFKDITSEVRATELAERSAQAAQNANSAKSSFLANMSHEIRTPLTAILGYSEILKDDEIDQAMTKRAMGRIDENAKHLHELVDDILDISKIESGKLDIELEEFVLKELISRFLFDFQDRAQKKKIKLVAEWDHNVPVKIYSCPKRLKQILLNIIGNALKFTTAGSITLTVKYSASDQTDSGNVLIFQVKDTGCGMAIESQKKLFQLFSQADSSITRKFGGSGLGLYLSQNLAEKLGGDIILRESSPGAGSTFEVTIDPGTIGAKKQKQHDNPAKDKNFVDAAEKEHRSKIRLKERNILLVEDGKDNQQIISIFLESCGATVEIANHGKEALALANAGKFDVVLMDTQMPIMDGLEATRLMIEDGFKQPIIALTAHATTTDRDLCFAAGCSNFLSKPVNKELLISTIEQELENALVYN